MTINFAINCACLSEGLLLSDGRDYSTVSGIIGRLAADTIKGTDPWLVLCLYPINLINNSIMIAWHLTAATINALIAGIFAGIAYFATDEKYERASTTFLRAYDNRNPIRWTSNHEGWKTAAYVNLELAAAGALFTCVLFVRIFWPAIALKTDHNSVDPRINSGL